ncbi:MAG: HD domain-containing protein [Chloroflexi bacterium]|nr:HD domain-containing protein [Chloroflexota bacterium]
MAGLTELSERFDDALGLAVELHRAQRRKGSETPYVSHLFAVCGLALEGGADEDTAIAALLHDAIEDQGGKGTALAIRERFGARVEAIVWGCTDTDGGPKKAPWRERKEAYIAHLATAMPEVRLLAACDKLHNARTIVADVVAQGPEVWTRFKAAPEEILWYYRSVLAELQRDSAVSHLRELAAVVEELAGCVAATAAVEPAMGPA